MKVLLQKDVEETAIIFMHQHCLPMRFKYKIASCSKNKRREILMSLTYLYFGGFLTCYRKETIKG
jgi:hypothetical protein